ncbi:DEHA2C16918p [Debaryomyces hansenii CBS767]|uniref:Histone deacetylase n=1 Tax=Debaryomyces hansenii (strain ATCC 36239 / CBS 767 / BCRC 21394 / JCM 1990 / NBRC 0083 / IGC 2968) TaxID=284592 RepID=Q6BTP5_DEBHA|nr:DEHA2C16918p [Debaryomyces hansenii CBS767]CAG86506.2 DEHA2C16918p [Debaryomyces hansenii CBS767]|eukprot:XP_458424.2 DEHA2C16918p [Debaryomyces hansenii CBS767]
MSESFSENTETPKALESKTYDEKVDGEGVEKSTENAAKDEVSVKHELSNSEELENGHALKRAKLEESLKNKNTIIVVPPTKPQLFYSPLKTGLVYDVRMRYHAKIFTSYFEYIDPHPEDPRRIYRIYKKLAEAGLIQDSSLSGIDEIGPLMVKIPIREASAEEILEVHSEEHLRFIESTETMSRERLLEETERGDSIYVNNDSYLSAKLSCGGTIEACKAVIEGRVKNSLAVVRPPGHHAEPDTPGGFCLFSNVAVAAKNILKRYPESVRRIVIVDWDIHHGNGTQKAFYDDPRVLYISLHRYENGKFYPGTKYGNSTQTGEGAGEGYSLNIPWRTPGMDDGDYFYAFNKVVIPVITEFDPDLVIVSSGFDAADGDIIGGCHVSPTGYGHMTHLLKGIAKGKLCVVLEGGYNLDSISKSALGVAKVLVGEPPENTIRSQPHIETLEVIDEVIKIQSKYWNCLKPGNPTNSLDDVYDLPNDNTAYKLTNIADPIRSHQVEELFNRYSFINLPIVAASKTKTEQSNSFFTTDLPPSLEDLIVASPDIYDCSTIIISVHDPPEIWANINPINGSIEGSASVVLEHPLTQMIEKIKKETSNNSNIANEKIGYIDINIPSYALSIPSLNNGNSKSATQSTYNPTIFAQELLLYVWDNYLAYFSQLKKLVFVGFGDSYQSIVHLYAKRPSSEIKNLVQGTVIFVNRSALKPLVPVMDESMVDWYYQNSVVFTSCLHSCWNGSSGATGTSLSRTNGSTNNGNEVNGIDNSKRPRRKFGRVLKASSDGLWEVISERFDEGIDFVLDSIEEYSSSGSSN